MADTRLSALTEFTGTPADIDELYIRDESEAAADESKRILFSTLRDAIATLLKQTQTKTANYTVVASDDGGVILCDATTAAFTITLLAAATAGDGFNLSVKKTDSSANAVTIDGNVAETIDGAATFELSSQYHTALIVCDASNWHLIFPAGVLRTD